MQAGQGERGEAGGNRGPDCRIKPQGLAARHRRVGRLVTVTVSVQGGHSMGTAGMADRKGWGRMCHPRPELLRGID